MTPTSVGSVLSMKKGYGFPFLPSPSIVEWVDDLRLPTDRVSAEGGGCGGSSRNLSTSLPLTSSPLGVCDLRVRFTRSSSSETS